MDHLRLRVPVGGPRRFSSVTVARNALMGLADQALISGATFIVVVLLARRVQPTDFGIFVLAHTGLLFLAGVQLGLVTQPHNVLGSGFSGNAYRTYTASTAAVQGLLLALVVAAIVGLTGLLAALGSPHTSVVAGLAAAVVGTQWQEFARRVLYTENRVGLALVSDLLNYGGQIVLCGALYVAGALTGARAFSVMAATSLLGTAFAAWHLRRSVSGGVELSQMRENWRFGKWLAASSAGYWLSFQVYLYSSAVYLGTASAGALKAAQVVLGPLNVLLIFLSTVLPIHIARSIADEGDRRALPRPMVRAYLSTAPIVVAYCATVTFFAEPVLHRLYGGRYDTHAVTLGLMALFYLLSYHSQLIAAALSAQQQTRAIFVSAISGAALGVALCIPLIALWGVAGAAAAMSVAAGLQTLLSWMAYRLRWHLTLGADRRSRSNL